MNNKGQTLIIFVVLLPILILLLAFVVDTGLILKEHTKLNGTIKTILKSTYQKKDEENYQEMVTDLFVKNNLSTTNLVVEVQKDFVTIKSEYAKESIFGKIIGIKEYKIKCALKATQTFDTLKIEKE